MFLFEKGWEAPKFLLLTPVDLLGWIVDTPGGRKHLSTGIWPQKPQISVRQPYQGQARMAEDSLGSCLCQIQEKGTFRKKGQKKVPALQCYRGLARPEVSAGTSPNALSALWNRGEPRSWLISRSVPSPPSSLRVALSAAEFRGLRVAWGCHLYLRRWTRPDPLRGSRPGAPERRWDGSSWIRSLFYGRRGERTAILEWV